MQEIYQIFNVSSVGSIEIVFLMGFSCFLAIFYTVIAIGLFRAKLRPKWLFFVVNPLIVGLPALLDERLAIVVFVILFFSLFIFFFVGMIWSFFTDSKESKKKRQAFQKKHNIKPTPRWKSIITPIVLIFLFVFITPYAILLLFIFIPVLKAILPSAKKRLLSYQSTLPTSNIRSVAMGLAEIKGQLVMDEPLVAPINNKPCIGFTYIIESIHRDDKGRESFSTLFKEAKYNRFSIKDDTGVIKVNPDNLEMIWFDVSERYRRDGKRFSQYTLCENDDVLIVGKASLENNQPVIVYEDTKKVFGIVPLEKVNHYNEFKPLLNSFVFFSSIFAFIVAVLLVTPMRVEENRVIFEFSAKMLSW